MRWVYLSPHLDDAILSCGGLVYEQSRQGTPVAIWTIMAGVPCILRLSAFAAETHAMWGTGSAWQTVFLRRREDRHAAQVVGAQIRHFGFPDMIYRRSDRGEFIYTDSVFVPAHPSDANLPARITETLENYLHPEDVVVSPMGLGGHLDHMLVRSAAEMTGRLLWYYADIPYVLRNPEHLAPVARRMTPSLFPISEDGLRAWQKSILAYASQISSLFADEREMEQMVRNHWQAEAGIRLWRVE